MNRASLALAWLGVLVAGTWIAAGASASPEARRWSVPADIADHGLSVDERCPAVAGDPLGRTHAAWLDQRDGLSRPTVFTSSLAPLDHRWATNDRVVTADSDRLRSCPSIAVDSLGAVHVVWESFVDGQPDIMHSVRRPTDAGWSIPKRVNDEYGQAAQWSPLVAPDRSGNVHVVWVDYRDGTADIRHRRRNADGTWRASVRVNGETSGEQASPALTASPNGSLFVVWRDARNGANQIYGSRLPQYGDAWWPNAALSVSGEDPDHRAPSVTSDGRGGVHAVWIDGATNPTSLRSAELRVDDPERPFWAPDRLVYQPTRGDVLSVDVAGGAGGNVVVLWGESRPGSSRIYASPLAREAPLQPERVDEGRAARDGLDPRAVVDATGRAQVLWEGTDRLGDRAVFYAHAQLDEPEYSAVEASGWLHYTGRSGNCGGDTYAVVDCDGNTSLPILSRDIDLEAWVGKHVIVNGQDVADTGCRHVSATQVLRELPDCEREDGSVTGRVLVNGSPLEGATVTLAGTATRTGANGRFFFADVSTGEYVVTAAARCALTAVTEPVAVRPDGRVTLADGSLVRADATEDGVVDSRDVVLVAAARKLTSAERPYCADIDRDNTVGVHDLQEVARFYGMRAPAAWGQANLAGQPGATPSAGTATDAALTLWLPDCRVR